MSRLAAPSIPGSDQRVPVNVITGFLGSGKTTLLKRLLGTEEFANCAVLINELGEIGLDHELLDYVDQETIVLQNGCICCGIRDDLRTELARLHNRRERGAIHAFDRVLIETTGLADPVPVLNTMSADEVLRHHFRAGNVLVTVDAVNGLNQLETQPESVKQAAIADRLVITKADLVDAGQLSALHGALRRINSLAPIVESYNNADAAAVLLGQDIHAENRLFEVKSWFEQEAAADGNGSSYGLPLRASAGQRLGPAHRAGVGTALLVVEKPIDWIAFGVWFSMLLHSHGNAILRVKGILNVRGSEAPTVVHGVQHLIHPPVHLSAWPTDDRRSRLVLIGDLPETERLQRSLELFNG
jgi:G3E family GTPase